MIERLNSFSKEAIKVRMLQNAVKIWGLKSINSIDPFVSLLIDAFATEIFKTNNEIQASDSRILEKLAKLLTPSVYTYPQPAHAIAYAFPNDSVEILPSYSEFFVKKQISASAKSVSDIQLDVHFTPIDAVRLIRMDTLCMITSNMCYHIDKERNKIPLAKVPSLKIAPNKIIVGIDVTSYGEHPFPSKLAFYCSNPTFENIDFVFNLLPFITVTHGGHALDINAGLTYEASRRLFGYEEIFREHSIEKRIEENVKNLYKHKFIEISGLKQDAAVRTIPESLAFLEAHKETSIMLEGKKMVWLEMIFPPQYTADILENFSFTLNAFPIYNRKWKNNEYSLNVMGDNVPLSTDTGEHFLYVDKVEDSYGNLYQEIPFQRSTGGNNMGLYTIRKGGMERFNERNALEMISNVLELTRDEVSAFGVLERDKVVEALKEMTSQMRVLDQKVVNAERSVIQDINYVIVNPYENIEHLRAIYWVTHCSLANNIRYGTVLTQPKITDVTVNQFVRLLTPTTGGTEEQKGTNAIQAYKYALTTRDKLISMEDIKNFCYMELRNDVRLVTTKRGTIISDKPKEGFVKTIEIEIVPNSYASYGKKYWDTISLTLKQQILHRGIDGIEYVVSIKDMDYE